MTSSNLADALLVLAEAFLAGQAAAADNPEIYQVVIHAGTDVLAPDDPAGGAGGAGNDGGQSGETPAGVSADLSNALA